jgi:hypothetical protein
VPWSPRLRTYVVNGEKASKEVRCNISGGGAGLLAGAGTGYVTKNVYAAGAVGAGVDRYVTSECESQ